MNKNVLAGRLSPEARIRAIQARESVRHYVTRRQWWAQQLAPGHPYVGTIPEAETYSRERSREARKPVRDANRYIVFRMLLDLVRACPEGDYAELGTYRGMLARVMWQNRCPGTTLWCFDTFEGFDDADLNAEGTLPMASDGHRFTDTSLASVQAFVTGGAAPDGLVFRVGYFPQTFEGLEDRTFRFVHLDADLYEPLRSGLETFWPRLVEGGVILVHDYFSEQYPRAKEAVDEFFLSRGITPVPLNDRSGTALVIRARGMSAD